MNIIRAVGLKPGATPALHLLKQQMQSHAWEMDHKLEGSPSPERQLSCALTSFASFYLSVLARSPDPPLLHLLAVRALII